MKKLFASLLLSALALNSLTVANLSNITAEETSESLSESSQMSEEMVNHEEMVHDESGEIPKGLEEAQDPTFPKDTPVIIKTDHMPGMQEADGMVVGAFETIVYEVSYTDTETGEEVKNHKWVVHEEIEEVQEEPYEVDDEVVLAAKHMPGMEGAKATIDSAEETTVYMVTYTDTETGDTIENHKWVTEAELAAKE